jgi:hypothetical protein
MRMVVMVADDLLHAMASGVADAAIAVDHA